jgi:hypothetical protein
MAEVGLIRFARVAMQVVGEVLPAYRAKFYKPVFAQPQLFAVLCLRRFEKWTFREAEVWLKEHAELHAALEHKGVADHTTL